MGSGKETTTSNNERVRVTTSTLYLPQNKDFQLFIMHAIVYVEMFTAYMYFIFMQAYARAVFRCQNVVPLSFDLHEWLLLSVSALTHSICYNLRYARNWPDTCSWLAATHLCRGGCTCYLFVVLHVFWVSLSELRISGVSNGDAQEGWTVKELTLLLL